MLFDCQAIVGGRDAFGRFLIGRKFAIQFDLIGLGDLDLSSGRSTLGLGRAVDMPVRS